MQAFDKAVTRAIQSMGEGFLPFMEFISGFGNPAIYFLIVIIAAWCFNYRFGVRLGLLIVLSGALNGFLKAWFHSPRPFVVDPDLLYQSSEVATSFGMPSGHAQLAITLWGYLMYSSKRVSVWALGFTMVSLIGISRVYLGAHWMSQVMMGWSVGLVLVITFVYCDQKIGKWIARQTVSKQVSYAILMTGLLVVAAILVEVIQDYDVELLAIAQGHLTSAMSMSGLFAGFAIGYSILYGKRILLVRADWWKQILKVVICFFSIVIYVIVTEFFEDTLGEQSSLARLAMFLSHLGMGLWIAYIAPLVFLTLRLVEEKKIAAE